MNTNKIYTYETDYGKYEVKLARESYTDDNLAVLLMTRPDPEDLNPKMLSDEQQNEFTEEFALITVNLPDSTFLPEDTAYIDENNHPGIGDWLLTNGIAKPTGRKARRGFCVYPAYKFN